MLFYFQDLFYQKLGSDLYRDNESGIVYRKDISNGKLFSALSTDQTLRVEKSKFPLLRIRFYLFINRIIKLLKKL